MTKHKTKIHGAWLLRPKLFSDERGFFLESWNVHTFSNLGINEHFVQDNQSRSLRNVLRGLHYQVGSATQGKLVWVTSGTVFDVIVDLRSTSPSFGLWHGLLLSAKTHERLWVPAGCAHGFLVTSEHADFHYKCTAPYVPHAERTLKWDDEELDISWPLVSGEPPIISRKDACGMSFAECEKFS
jgi:dTDP-4-dehydrorhamnose 3,5-epimerase